MKTYDVAVIGGGIVGVAAAMAITGRTRASLIVLEAESKLAAHQTGHNSGVIHSGLYYKPGSMKAANCVEGRELLYRFCDEHAIAHERCGKLVVATSPADLPALDDLERRGRGNGLQGLRRIGAGEIRDLEPAVAGVAGLHVPDTGIVDYAEVTQVYASQVLAAGGDVRTGARVNGITRERGGLVLRAAAGEVHARALINCAGLHSDRVARMAGVEPGLIIVPFRGEYYTLVPARHHLVRNLIYPVPDPRFPFLGVHFTRMIHGGVEAGPNAVLAFKREGYRRSSLSLGDSAELIGFPGFWRMAARHWRKGIGEMYRSLSTRAFVRVLQRLVPELTREDVAPGGAGVRAQALEPDGALVDDFRIVEAERMIHVLNAPSPAATASISIGRAIAAMAVRNFGLAV